MSDEWTDSFDRSGAGTLRGAFTERMPGWWEIGNSTTASMSCKACGNVVTLEPGESISYDDPRVCEHFQSPRAAAGVSPKYGKKKP
jgi:hypothetical protein